MTITTKELVRNAKAVFTESEEYESDLWVKFDHINQKNNGVFGKMPEIRHCSLLCTKWPGIYYNKESKFDCTRC